MHSSTEWIVTQSVASEDSSLLGSTVANLPAASFELSYAPQFTSESQWQTDDTDLLNVTENSIKSHDTYEELELLSSNWQVFLVALYTLTATIALLGNLVAILVLTTGKRSSKELRLFLVNLSLADCLMATFSIPFTYTQFMLGRWIFAPAFCPVVQMIQITAVFVSVYTLIAIGIDRYIAIMYPLRQHRPFGLLIIGSIWVAAIILGLIHGTHSWAEPILIANETNYYCSETWTSDQTYHFTITVFLVTFAVPLILLSFTYGSIVFKIFRHSTPGNADLARDRAQHSSKVKIIKMLSTIVMLFLFCWLPWHTLQILINIARNMMVSFYDSHFIIYVTIIITTHWLSMANSFVNPIIYCFMSENFRADLRVLLHKCMCSESARRRYELNHFSTCRTGTTTVTVTTSQRTSTPRQLTNTQAISTHAVRADEMQLIAGKNQLNGGESNPKRKSRRMLLQQWITRKPTASAESSNGSVRCQQESRSHESA